MEHYATEQYAVQDNVKEVMTMSYELLNKDLPLCELHALLSRLKAKVNTLTPAELEQLIELLPTYDHIIQTMGIFIDNAVLQEISGS
jgi:hypothetical protein